MLRILRKITNNCFESKSDFYYERYGNYKVFRTPTKITHYYFGNIICVVNIENETFYLYSCGYKKKRLTTAQLNYLETFYKSKNYTLLKKE